MGHAFARGYCGIVRLPFRLHATNLLLLLGFAALAGSFALPHWTAARVARIEIRAEEIVAMLAELAPRPGILDGTEPTQGPGAAAVAELLAEARQRGAALGHPPSWLVDPVPAATTPDRLSFVCKHYVFLVARTPPSLGSLRDAPLAERPIEVWGWPREEDGAGRSVFQFRAGRAWFCRNLNGRYLGEARAPTPGIGQPRKATDSNWYWGTDGERWLARRG